MSWTSSRPTGRPSESTTGRWSIWPARRLWAAATARSSGETVRGFRPITPATGRVKSTSSCWPRRRRSPSVKRPTSFPDSSTTLAAPGRPTLLITAAVSRRLVSLLTVGLAAPVRITSRSSKSRYPSAPAGCSSANCSGEKPRRCSTVIASASPSASSATVLVVGASPSGHASGTGPISSTTSAAAASELFWPPVTAMMGAPSRLSAGNRRKISSVSPLFESATTRSPGTSRPRSPCNASAGWRNKDGVPVDANVALIFFAMNPGLPMPVTTTLPEHARIRLTAPEQSPSIPAQTRSIGDGPIYRYFKSNDGLLLRLVDENMTQLLAEAKAALAEERDAPSRLKRFIQLHFSLVERNPDLASVLVVELRQSAQFLKSADRQKLGAAYLDLIAQVVREGQEKGELAATVSPGTAKRAIFGALDELALGWLLSGRPPSLKKTGHEVAEWLGRRPAAPDTRGGQGRIWVPSSSA